jgi:tetratricopeptide (TPR) repeat protein
MAEDKVGENHQRIISQKKSAIQLPVNQPEKTQARTSPAVTVTRGAPQTKKATALALAMSTERGQSQVPSPAANPATYRQSPAQTDKTRRQRVAAQSGGIGVSEEGAALYLQGLALQREDSFEEAKKMYEAALKISPNLASAWNNMGTIYMKERNYGSAIIAFQKALRIKPNDADPYYNLACLYALQRNVGQSLSYLRKAIAADDEARQWAITDDDLKNLRGHAEFKEIVDSSRNL